MRKLTRDDPGPPPHRAAGMSAAGSPLGPGASRPQASLSSPLKVASAGAELSGTTMKKLIINGDDFGLAPAINQGIILAHQRGCLSSASLLVAGPAAEEAVQAARACPDLGLGLHLALHAERPVLPPETIPSLLDSKGRLPSNAYTFALRWRLGLIKREHARREIRAQLEKALDWGVKLTHLDGHGHLHVLPGLFEIVLEEMRRVGLTRVRIPLETAKVGRVGWVRRVLRCSLNVLARRAGRVARQAGFVFPDHFFGFYEAGHIDRAALLARIDLLQEGTTELAAHPGAGAGLPRPDLQAWHYEWAAELDALTDPKVHEILARDGILSVHYGHLQPRTP